MWGWAVTNASTPKTPGDGAVANANTPKSRESARAHLTGAARQKTQRRATQ